MILQVSFSAVFVFRLSFVNESSCEELLAEVEVLVLLLVEVLAEVTGLGFVIIFCTLLTGQANGEAAFEL